MVRLSAWLGLSLLVSGCVSVPVDEGQSLLADMRAAREAYVAEDYAAASKHYRRLTERWPESAEVWFGLGNSLARDQQPQAAIAAYREALVRDPDNRRAWYNIAYLQSQLLTATLLEMREHLPADDPAFLRLQAELRGWLDGLADPGTVVPDGATVNSAPAEPQAPAPAADKADGESDQGSDDDASADEALDEAGGEAANEASAADEP